MEKTSNLAKQKGNLCGKDCLESPSTTTTTVPATWRYTVQVAHTLRLVWTKESMMYEWVCSLKWETFPTTRLASTLQKRIIPHLCIIHSGTLQSMACRHCMHTLSRPLLNAHNHPPTPTLNDLVHDTLTAFLTKPSSTKLVLSTQTTDTYRPICIGHTMAPMTNLLGESGLVEYLANPPHLGNDCSQGKCEAESYAHRHNLQRYHRRKQQIRHTMRLCTSAVMLAVQ